MYAKIVQAHEQALAWDFSFHHSLERIRMLRLNDLGLDYRPPQQRDGDGHLEEAIQMSPTVRVFPSVELAKLERLALAWGQFFPAAYELFSQAHEDNDSIILKLVGNSLEQQEWKVHPGYASLMPLVRLDMLWDGKTWKVCDINSSRPAGVGWMETASRILSQEFAPGKSMPFFSTLEEEALACYREWSERFATRTESQPFIVVAVAKHQGTLPSYRALARLFREAGHDALIAHDDELKVEGGKLIHTLTGKKVDMVIRGLKPDLHANGQAVTQVYPNGVCVVPPLYRRHLGHKSWMFLIPKFTDFFKSRLGEGLFSILEESLLETHLLQGGLVFSHSGEELGQASAFNRRDWVIKDSQGSSANGIYLGFDHTRTKWLDVLDRLAEDRDHTWLWQRRINQGKEPILLVNPHSRQLVEEQLYSAYGLYIHGGKFAGVHRMSGRLQSKIHGGIGTIFTPCFSEQE